jgi:hypothetical protein
MRLRVLLPGLVAYIRIIIICVLLLMALTPKARASDLALGDSIALGTGHALGVPTVARVGAGSCEIADWLPRRGSYRRVVISAGINDQGLCVQALRAGLRAKEVIWILPAPINAGRGMVQAVMQPGDKAVSYRCAGPCTRSNFHPASYPAVARAIRRVW